VSVLFPLLCILGGLAVGRYRPTLRIVLARILTNGLIPYVIVYNLLTYKTGTALLAGFSFIFCMLLFLLGRVFWKDKLAALCFSYLNIGWLGLPLAVAIFGDSASRIIIAAYIGSSVFGNIASVAALQPLARWEVMAERTLLSPPVLAVLTGLGLRWLPFDLAAIDELGAVYVLAKYLMSITGMSVLGIWLYSSSITLESVRAAVPTSLTRAIVGSAIVGLFVLTCHELGIELVVSHALTLFILPLLPPAANIVVLETHYRGTGTSARTIASGTLVSLGLLSVFAIAVLLTS